jgi:hypothetical protein
MNLILKRSHYLVLLVFTLLQLTLSAQRPKMVRSKDTIVSSTFFFSASGAYQISGGDLYDRFGNNGNAGASFGYKTEKNWFFSLQWSYLFGTDLREDGILDSIATSDGFLLDKEGKTADIRLFERGFTVHAYGGKVFTNFLSPNPNSGPLLLLGLGMMQHKIRIIDNGGRTPQLSGDYLKGYDRLTSGFSTSQLIGYWFMSRNRYVNIFGGFEFMQGFTQSRRSWDYDLMRADTAKRVDLLTGFRIGWVIPFGRRGTSSVYYY